MKRKIKKYLSFQKNKYNNLCKIFELYLNGSIKKQLSKYTEIGIYPTLNRNDKTIQLNYNYSNIHVIIDFFEDKYDVAIFPTNTSIDDLEFFSINYHEDFKLERLIKEVDEKIKNHPKLKKYNFARKKQKIYSLIASISLWIPIVIFVCIGLYCIITESIIKLNIFWGLFFIAIPLIIWWIFDVKSRQ